uniref:RRP15-like protein n=1 Tax=Rhabditophanes sp. KR3021 TaxID=114890 RepID=A0AC35U3E8_9BILA
MPKILRKPKKAVIEIEEESDLEDIPSSGDEFIVAEGDDSEEELEIEEYDKIDANLEEAGEEFEEIDADDIGAGNDDEEASEDSAQYDDDSDAVGGDTSDEEGVVPNADMKVKMMRSVQFDSAKVTHKKEVQKYAEEHPRPTRKQLAIAQNEKEKLLKLGLVKPNFVTDREKERALARIATIGVTKLFNDVLQQRKIADEIEKESAAGKAVKIDTNYQTHLDAMPRTSSKFAVKRKFVEEEEVVKSEVDTDGEMV